MIRPASIASLALLTAALLPLPQARAQHVSDPSASITDARARQALLRSTTDPRLQRAVASLKSCAATPLVPAPTGQIHIPHHYLNGSHGATNPAEAAATRPYLAFEDRITAGADQFVATGNQGEAQCALDQLDQWARSKALLDYDAKAETQSWFQVGWTLCSAGIVASILRQDAALDPAEQHRVQAWLNAAAHRLISFEKPGEPGNNLQYWRALAATSIGVTTADDSLFRFGTDTYKQAIAEINPDGALPREMERHERATHYQAFALQPLVVIAEFAARQQVDLYGYSAHNRTLRDAIVFFGRAVDDPTLVTKYTPDTQLADYGGSDYAPFEFFAARFGAEGLPPSIRQALTHPTAAARIGGNTTVLAARPGTASHASTAHP